MDEDFAFFPEERLGDLVLPRHWQLTMLGIGALNALVGIGVFVDGMISGDLGACFGLIAGTVLVASALPSVRVALRTGWSRHDFKTQAFLAVCAAAFPYLVALAFAFRVSS